MASERREVNGDDWNDEEEDEQVGELRMGESEDETFTLRGTHSPMPSEV